MGYFYIFLSALFVSLLTVPSLRQWAVNSGRLDQPERRKIHKEALPRIGGVAIFISFLFSILVFYEISPEIRGLLAGSLIIFLVGLVDDIAGLNPRQKLFGQAIAASLAIALSGIWLESLGNIVGIGEIVLPAWAGIPFTVFAVVGVANAINMVDGLDGLAGGISVIAFGGFLILGWQAENSLVIGTTLAGLGAVLGFLKDNSYPASIFMGDSGSLVLGFILGLMAVFLTQTPGNEISPIVPVIILGLPIADTLTVMLRRMRKGLSPFYPDLTHVHHKFLNLGFHHRFTVIIIYSVTLLWTVLAVAGAGHVPDYLFFWGYLVFVILMYRFLRYMLNHPEKFEVLRQDSQSSLRTSVFYRRLVSAGRYAIPALVVLVTLFFLLSSISCGVTGQQGLLHLAFLIVAGGLLMLLVAKKARARVMMVFYVSAIMLTVFLAEQNCSELFLGVMRFETLTNLIFVGVGGLVVYKIVFREEGELYMTTPLDFLLLAITLSFAVVSPEMWQGMHLADVCVKTIILILAIKILSSRSFVVERVMYWGLQLVLVTFVIKNIV